MTVAAITKGKVSAVVSVNENDGLHTVSEKLVQHNLGAVVVLDDAGNLAGIISERDLVRAFAGQTASLATLHARDIMTKRVYTCSPQESELRVMTWMTEREIRHMPVVDEGKVVGMVTLGEAVKYRLRKINHLVETVTNEGDEEKRFGLFTRHLLSRKNPRHT